VWPNPFGTRGAFLAGDTGGAIIAKHIDTYDWLGRANQDAWGVHYGVSVTKAASPGAGNTTGEAQAPATSATAIQAQCWQLAGAPVARGQYVNPFRSSTSIDPNRIDMGVDYAGTGPIDAIGNAIVTYAAPGGVGWGPFSCSGGHGAAITYRLTDGPDTGRYVYLTEGIMPTVAVGQRVAAGQPIATFTGCIETGWSTGVGANTMAAALGQQCKSGDPGCVSTWCGQNMSQLIHALGGPAGIPQGPISGTGC
jgi:murein DD-endopeptidase MepM/ murein hydrolase activator NlpD